MTEATIAIEVAWVEHGAVRLSRLAVPAESTLQEALSLACGAGLVRAEALGELGVAVYGRRRSPEERLRAGDRIELLGPLRADPKEARRRRVAHRRAAGGRDKWSAG